MEITLNQTFSFDFPVIVAPNNTELIFTANIKWLGSQWETTLVPPNKKRSLSRAVQEQVVDLPNMAEQYGEQLLKQFGYEIPDKSVGQVHITAPHYSAVASPEEQLMKIKNTAQEVTTMEPTSHLRYEDEVLLQLWEGTIKRWEKGQTPVCHKIHVWKTVEGQPTPVASPTAIA